MYLKKKRRIKKEKEMKRRRKERRRKKYVYMGGISQDVKSLKIWDFYP